MRFYFSPGCFCDVTSRSAPLIRFRESILLWTVINIMCIQLLYLSYVSESGSCVTCTETVPSRESLLDQWERTHRNGFNVLVLRLLDMFPACEPVRPLRSSGTSLWRVLEFRTETRREANNEPDVSWLLPHSFKSFSYCSLISFYL